MRLWSLHPAYLDGKGLVALWREGLLAQKVLAGQTRGYRHHPQLDRFRRTRDPLGTVGAYLFHVAREAADRNYRFDISKIRRLPARKNRVLSVTRGQVNLEFEHLLKKLKVRDARRFRTLSEHGSPGAHPLFRIVPGTAEKWEKTPH